MKPMLPHERQRYHNIRRAIRSRMRATDRSGRITVDDVAAALRAAGYARSPRYVRAVLSGEKVSRPALREISAAIGSIRERMERGIPDWL